MKDPQLELKAHCHGFDWVDLQKKSITKGLVGFYSSSLGVVHSFRNKRSQIIIMKFISLVTELLKLTLLFLLDCLIYRISAMTVDEMRSHIVMNSLLCSIIPFMAEESKAKETTEGFGVSLPYFETSAIYLMSFTLTLSGFHPPSYIFTHTG